MKRILTVLPAVICLIISLCVPVSALADDYSNPTECIIPVDWFTDNAPLKKYYFHMAYSYNPDSSPSDTEVDTIFFHTDQEPEVVTEPGKITITFTNDVSYRLVYCRVDRGIMGSNPGTFKTVVIDTVNKTASFDGYSYPNNTQYKHNISSLKFDSSLFEASSGDLEVEFFQELSGEFDYKTFEYQGVKLQDYPYFTFDVINNSNTYSYQYAFLIVEKDEQLNYHKVVLKDEQTGDGYYNGNFLYNRPIFSYITDEWAYSSFYIVQGSNAFNPQLTLSPCMWHFIEPGKRKEISIDWKQFKLLPGKEYDCVVVGCKKDSSVDAYNKNVVNFISDKIYSYNSSDPYEVYRSSFSVKYATPYDPNFTTTTSSGDVIYSYNPDADNSSTFDKLYAKVDEKGDYVRIEGNYSDLALPSINNRPSSGGFSGVSSDFGDISITSFSGMFSSVFGAVSMFMNYLPSSITSIYIFGFSCIVVIAVIKAVR